jgi:alkylated DNA repair protein (DNA oxidative demethylase)
VADLFSNSRPGKQEIYPDLFVLANFVKTAPLLKEVERIIKVSPFRKMMTPNGHYTGVALTNCGDYGWTSDRKVYRYSKIDPLNGRAWQSMPDRFKTLAIEAAFAAGFENFEPDACLINQYLIGTKLGSHQDKNETDFSQPIVSVSIGLSAIFQIFGNQRAGKAVNYRLHDGDVVVWGNSARLAYHGVRTLTIDELNPSCQQRINITFRKSH